MSSTPIHHSQAGGIHPGAYAQDSEPDTTDAQDGVLWVDTRVGPPYQLKLWHASLPGWVLVGVVSDAVGVDGSGALRVDCLTFPHGQRVCGDVSATLRFLMGGGHNHAMDDTGYTLPGGHRLEVVPT